jgi:hypothetical protein
MKILIFINGEYTVKKVADTDEAYKVARSMAKETGTAVVFYNITEILGISIAPPKEPVNK